MKKKFNLLVLTPILIATAGTGIALQASASNDIELSSQITANTNFFFKGTYGIDSTMQLDYEDIILTMSDQISATNRVNRTYLYGSLFDELSVVKSGAGHALQEYISLENTVETRTLLDEDGNPVNFDAYYGNPFKSFANLSNSQINSYFDISQDEENYVLIANDLAYGALTKSLINFYPAMELYYWDQPTFNTYIDDLKLVLYDDGTPASMSLTRIKQDRFGAIQEPITATFKSLIKVETVQPVKPSLTEAESVELRTKLDNFQDKLDAGNFTQNISIKLNNSEVVNYSNYYALTGNDGSSLPPMVISDCVLYDATYGETFISIARSSEGFIPYAVSPSSNYEGKMGDAVYSTIDEIIPHIGDISTDFFVKSGDYYAFNILAFTYADIPFSANLLKMLFTGFDPAVSIAGLYLNGSSYNFDNLKIGFDANDNLFGLLTYYASNGYIGTSQFSFNNIGTTVLEEVESIASAIEYFYTF